MVTESFNYDRPWAFRSSRGLSRTQPRRDGGDAGATRESRYVVTVQRRADVQEFDPGLTGRHQRRA